jgi:GNAT superfamily N-acetyltransferase
MALPYDGAPLPATRARVIESARGGAEEYAMSVSNVLVRPAHEDDLPRVGELLRDCIAAMRADGVEQWDDVYPNASTMLADVRGGTLYVASAKGFPIAGAFTINDRQDPEYADVPWTILAPRVAVVHRLMVHPRLQGGGLGPFLMRFAELRARRLGYRALRLDAFTANPRALRLYATLGYHDAGAVTFRKGVFRCFEKDLAVYAP